MSKPTKSVIACIQVITICWLIALLLAVFVVIVFFGHWLADVALLATAYLLFILFFSACILIALNKRQSWAWYAAVLYLLLHLIGILAPLALFGLWDIFKLEVQSDFGLARSPIVNDSLSHINNDEQ